MATKKSAKAAEVRIENPKRTVEQQFATFCGVGGFVLLIGGMLGYITTGNGARVMAYAGLMIGICVYFYIGEFMHWKKIVLMGVAIAIVLMSIVGFTVYQNNRTYLHDAYNYYVRGEKYAFLHVAQTSWGRYNSCKGLDFSPVTETTQHEAILKVYGVTESVRLDPFNREITAVDYNGSTVGPWKFNFNYWYVDMTIAYVNNTTIPVKFIFYVPDSMDPKEVMYAMTEGDISNNCQ